MDTLLLIVHTWNSSPLWSNLLRLKCSCSTVPTTSGRPYESPLVWACQSPSSQPIYLLNSLKATASERRERPKVTGSKVSTIGTVRNCLDAHPCQIIWKGWSCGLVHCPGENATDPIWRVLASSDRIFSWTPLKPQHSNPNPNPLANQLWSIDLFTPPTPLNIPHRLPAFFESLMPLKNWFSIHARWSKSV